MHASPPAFYPQMISFYLLHLKPTFKTLFFSFPPRFIIELCEPIQVKQLDIANFELFSSTPKDFLVSISDRYALQLHNTYNIYQCITNVDPYHRHDYVVHSCRYPTNKWLKLGTFHARDERTVQSFPLDEHLYAKYVKVSTILFIF